MTVAQSEPLEEGQRASTSTRDWRMSFTAGTENDPYLTWAWRTDFRYLAGGTDRAIRLAGWLRDGQSLDEATQAVNGASGAVFRARNILSTPFFTATMARPTNEACNALNRYAAFVLAQPGMRSRDATAPRDALLTEANLAAAAPNDPVDEDIVIGVVDGACGFANAAFCRAGKSRLACYWDQERTVPIDAQGLAARWQVPTDAGYGRELVRPALNEIAQQLASGLASTPQRVEAEKALYRDLGHDVPADADWSHGAHVLGTVLDELGDQAAAAVIFVQLPEAALRDTGARWAAAYVLDAIDYIVSRAKMDAKIVINLSLGAFAGPHDGTSVLERAIDFIAEESEGRITFVVAAGNAGKVADDGTGSSKKCHARLTLEAADESGSQCTLWWDIDRPDGTESFMELWVHGSSQEHSAGLGVSLEHERDPAMTIHEVGPNLARHIADADAVAAMVINSTASAAVPNGQRGMALIALGHTREFDRSCAPTGRWKVTVANKSASPATVDAWIERRDIPGELLGYRPQYGFTDDTPHLTADGSLGTLANGKRSIVVGALELNRDTNQFEIADYSSRGPSETAVGLGAARTGPDVYAIGRRTSEGFFSGTKKDLAGTSVAAAQVTAAIASALVDGASKQGKTVIDALLRLGDQRWENQMARRRVGTKQVESHLVILPRLLTDPAATPDPARALGHPAEQP